jgi:hypothetical protein
MTVSLRNSDHERTDHYSERNQQLDRVRKPRIYLLANTPVTPRVEEGDHINFATTQDRADHNGGIRMEQRRHDTDT